MQELHASIRSQLAVQAADLRALAQRLTSGPEAEDCVQNTMVVALSQRQPPRKLRPWLRQVLRNEIYAHHRVGNRRRNREQQSAAIEPTPSLDEMAEREQIAVALRIVLDELTEPYRSTLHRRFLLGHPMAQIAEDEGCSPATVRWRVHEGLRRMRRMLDERFEGRQQWLGGVALLAAGPVEGAAPAAGAGADTTMTEPTTSTTIATGTTGSLTAGLAKIAVAGTLVAGLGLYIGGRVEAKPASEGSSAAPMLASAKSIATPAQLQADHRGDAAPCDDGCSPEHAPSGEFAEDSSADTAEPGGPSFLGGNAKAEGLDEALIECEQLVDPDRDWGRIEVEIEIVGGSEGEPPYMANFDVTTGRKLPCGDPGVDEVTPADAEGVEHHPELAECLMGHIDLVQNVDPLMPGEAKQMIMVFTDGPTEALPEGSALPAPDEQLAQTEAERAPAALGLPVEGSTAPDAISVVECIDYDCPFCRRAQASVQQLLDEHPEVAVSVLANPLALHPTASLAARAAVAAGEQDAFWAMHEALLEDPALRDVESIVARAAELGLDVDRFKREMMSEQIGRQVATQAAVCNNAGARGTPSFFVGGDLVVGAQGYEALAESVRFELSQRP